MKKYSLKNFRDTKGIVTVEASIVMFFFIISYLLINSIILNLIVQADTRRALNDTIKDLSAYMQIIDRAGYKKDFATKNVSIEKYIGLVTDAFGTKDLDNLKEVIKIDVKELGKNKIFSLLIKNLFKKNSRESFGRYDDFGIVAGSDGINFTNVEILEDGESIDLEISYKWKTGLLGFLEGEKKIVQRASIRPWLNYIKQEEKQLDSIWKKDNFTRGKFFLEQLRNKSGVEVIKLGKGLDLYDRDTNTIKEIYSLNIFSDSYSENIGEGFLIKEGFSKKIEEYFKKMEKNIQKYGKDIEMESGEKISLENAKKELLIVLPEEARSLKDLSGIKSGLESKYGKVSFIFMEKAFDND